MISVCSYRRGSGATEPRVKGVGGGGGYPPPTVMGLFQKLEYENGILEHLKQVSIAIQLYRVSQKKRNGAFSVHCELKVLLIFISLDRVSSAEENGT